DGGPYLLREFAADLNSGHKVVSTVYVECGQLFRQSGVEHLRSIGEAEFAAVTARLAQAGSFGIARICEGFVGSAELERGEAIDELLEALMEASDGGLRGIRRPANWDPDPGINPSKRPYAP